MLILKNSVLKFSDFSNLIGLPQQLRDVLMITTNHHSENIARGYHLYLDDGYICHSYTETQSYD